MNPPIWNIAGNMRSTGRRADESRFPNSVLSSEPNTERRLRQGLEDLTGRVENPLAFRRNSSPRRRSPMIEPTDPASDQLIVLGDQHPPNQTVFKMSGTPACKDSALLWSSGDAPLGSGIVPKMRVPELSDSIFIVPSN
jgi:hypothetical protein